MNWTHYPSILFSWKHRDQTVGSGLRNYTVVIKYYFKNTQLASTFSQSGNRSQTGRCPTPDDYRTGDVELLPLEEVQTSFIGNQRNTRNAKASSRPQELPETQLSFGTEIEETFENLSFIRPPGFVQEEEQSSLLLTTNNTENNGINPSDTIEHGCYAGIFSEFLLAQPHFLVAICFGSGREKHEVGVAALDPAGFIIESSQFEDSRSFHKTFAKLNIFLPRVILFAPRTSIQFQHQLRSVVSSNTVTHALTNKAFDYDCGFANIEMYASRYALVSNARSKCSQGLFNHD